MSINFKYDGPKNHAVPLIRVTVDQFQTVIADLHRRSDIDDGTRNDAELKLTDLISTILPGAKVARLRDWVNRDVPATPEPAPVADPAV